MLQDNSINSVCFEEIYKNYQNRVRATVYKFGFRDVASEDLIQETFIQAWQNMSNLKNPEAIGSWLVVIARNRCLNELRATTRKMSISSTDCHDVNSSQAETVPVAQDEQLSIQYEYSLNLLNNLVQSHKVEPRATIAKKFYLDCLPVKDISIDLRLNSNTVLSHLRRFRQKVAPVMRRLAEENGLDVATCMTV